MYSFLNMVTKEQFKEHNEWSGNTITQTDKDKWLITDRFANKWRVNFTSVNQFTIFNDDEPFWVDIYCKGQNVEILQAGMKGKKLKSERYLKKFTQIAGIVSCYFNFNYMKLA